MSKFPFTIRFLLAVAFLMLSASGAAVWFVAPSAGVMAPWWTPFAVTGFFLFVIAGGLFILSGRKIFLE